MIPHARLIDSQNRARLPPAYLVLFAQMGHSIPLGAGRHQFRDATSFNIALSSICLANSFFSFAFFASSAFSLRTSDNYKPPNLAFHLWKIAELIPCSRHTSAFETQLSWLFRIAPIGGMLCMRLPGNE